MLKKIYHTGVAHPAPYSDVILPVLIDALDRRHRKVLDPFAGTGRIHELRDAVDWDLHTVGVEIEPEWAAIQPDTIVGNALDLPFKDHEFDAICTSPCYGNRFADSHVAKDDSVRRSYTHDIGRQLHKNNSGHMQWGDQYRDFHTAAWQESIRVLSHGGRFVLNISDHIRGGEHMYVSMWHINLLLESGLDMVKQTPVQTRRMRAGANSKFRVDHELVVVFDKPIKAMV
jgi:tRNA G10  N-methylase Trm11